MKWILEKHWTKVFQEIGFDFIEKCLDGSHSGRPPDRQTPVLPKAACVWGGRIYLIPVT